MQIEPSNHQPHLLLGYTSLLLHAGKAHGSAYHGAERQREKFTPKTIRNAFVNALNEALTCV